MSTSGSNTDIDNCTIVRSCILMEKKYPLQRIHEYLQIPLETLERIKAGEIFKEISDRFLIPDELLNTTPIPVFIDGKIYLEEESHTYHLVGSPDFRPVSGTTLIHNFFEHFDGPEIAKNLIATCPKYHHRTVEDLLEEWDQAGVSGTTTHLELENYILSHRHTPIITKKGLSGKQWIDRVWERGGYYWYPEVIVYDTEIGIAGTIDLILVDMQTGDVHLFDWKTNRKIHKRAYGGKTGCHPITRDIDDCNYQHYTIQLSIYQFLLEKNFGLNVCTRQILWLPEEIGTITYSCEYKPHVVKAMFSALQAQRKIDIGYVNLPLHNIEESKP